MRKRFIHTVAAILFSVALPAQNETKNIDKLKVFIDCSSTWCDMTFIRTEINLVDFMLDRTAADVHVLVTDQGTGSGGRKYQLIFFGQKSFKNLNDTIHFITDPNATDFERRDLLIKYMKLGLAPQIAKTNAAKDAVINFKRTETDADKKDSTTKTRDPWNYWVFNVGVNGNLSADEVYKNSSVSLNLSANRVTDELKTGFEVYAGKNTTVFKLDNGNGVIEKITNKNDNYSLQHYLIKSLGQHWSYGYEAVLSRSTFSNNKSMLVLRTGMEFAVFPYKQVNTKFFTVSYTVDARRNAYFDTTLYEKTKETLLGHAVETSLSFNQKWGTVSVGAKYHNYFHDWKLLNLSFNTELNIRITGGLSLNVYTYAELTRDQLFLPKGGATPQEVLTRRRQLASGYNFYTFFGLNYRFGSKLNNFVNPRFD
ncbi:MAG TPA: hypothetical protein VMZ03_01910 [Chitinophagaceae bacterium]|nr:hypothetical protein [Chitinophagaceae bacterium]